MTLIASVIAKEGVAIIADSLVTSSKQILNYSDYRDFVEKKAKNQKLTDTVLKELTELFKEETSHTRDHEDKLYEYDKFTAITTAGSAVVFGRSVKELVEEAIDSLSPNGQDSIEDKIELLRDFLLQKGKTYLQDRIIFNTTLLVVTNYNPINHKTVIYKIQINKAEKSWLESDDFELISVSLEPEEFPVVCDGQNRMIERILFGDFFPVLETSQRILEKIVEDFNIPRERITEEYKSSLIDSIFTKDQLDDITINQLALNLQQAVDLACLLMRIVVDIQKYTKNIPSVGGVVKLAVIDKNGFQFLAGDKIVRHENF